MFFYLLGDGLMDGFGGGRSVNTGSHCLRLLLKDNPWPALLWPSFEQRWSKIGDERRPFTNWSIFISVIFDEFLHGDLVAFRDGTCDKSFFAGQKGAVNFFGICLSDGLTALIKFDFFWFSEVDSDMLFANERHDPALVNTECALSLRSEDSDEKELSVKSDPSQERLRCCLSSYALAGFEDFVSCTGLPSALEPEPSEIGIFWYDTGMSSFRWLLIAVCLFRWTTGNICGQSSSSCEPRI